MALLDKDILITPNTGQTAEPKIEFKGASSTLGPQTISLNVYPTSNGTVSFEGSAGQLFSITNDLTGTLFSVNDVSGIPSIEVDADGTVTLAEFSGNVGIGTSTPTSKLDVVGTITATAFAGTVTGNATTATTLQTARTIGGVSFDGSANINLPGVNAAGNQNTTGNAATATTLQTARTIALSGAATGTATSFNGSANITIAVTSLNATNLSGVVPDASISGSYTGMTNLTGTGTVDFAKFAGLATDTVSTPSFTWTGDLTTGIYRPSASQVAVTIAGTQRGLFSATGLAVTGTVTGTNLSGTNTGDQTTITGNAGSATILQTGRTIALTGDVTYTSGSFNGSANVTGAATLASVGTAGTYTKVTTDAKGRVTSGTTLAAADIPALDAAKITTGTIDAARLPSYVDDVIEGANLAAFPATGETGKIYVALDTNKTYRWSGSAYVYITSGAVDSVAGKTGVVTLVKADVGLGSVDNTADSAKSVASAAILTTARTINGVSFNGSANITVADSTKLALTGGTLTGNLSINDASLFVGRPVSDAASLITTNTALTVSSLGVDQTATQTNVLRLMRDGTSGVIYAGAVDFDMYRHTVSTVQSNVGLVIKLSTIDTSTYYNALTIESNGVIKTGTNNIFHDGYHPNADVLTTARTINGVSFDGSANITVADGTKLPLAGGTMTGAITFAAGQTWPTFNQNTTGSAATLTTGRTIALTGDVTYTSGSFNGSANVTGTATLANSGVTAGTYTKVTVDAKGRVTVGASIAAGDIPTLNQNTTGNAATATILQTTRSIALSGAATGTATNFNGSANITIPVTGLNATNLDAGTVPDARITGTYTNFTHRLDGSNTVFTLPSPGSTNTTARTVYGLAEYRSSAGAQVGAIVFTAPTAVYNIMHQLEVQGLLYNQNIFRMTVQGYSNTSAATAWADVRKISFGTVDIQTRWAYTPTGLPCLILGDVGTTWSYPHFSIVRALFSHGSTSDTYCTGWSVGVVTSLTGYTQLTATIADSVLTGSISGNAVTVGGLSVHAATNNEANKIVRTDASGYLQTGWINTISGDNGTTAITRIYASSDNYIRTYTPTNFRTVLDVPTRTGGNASGSWAISVTGSSGSTTGNAATATTFSTTLGNYKGVTDGAVAGQLMWKNFGNGHTIFDASNSTSPAGGAVNNTNATSAWIATYPTLMGWNGTQTYGVRVDSARVADNGGVTSVTATTPIVASPTTGAVVLTHAASGVTAGTYNNVTVNATGHVTAGSNATYLTAEADTLATVTGRGFITRGSTSTFATADQGTPGLEIYGGGTTNPAYMTFHRPGQYAVRFGLDGTDLKVGGWSMGAVGHTILHAGNYNNYSPTLTGTGASGSWGISVTGSSGSTISPVFSGDSATKDNITTRTESGFYETITGTLAEGWPTDSGGYHHLISSTHSNDGNYYAMQISARFDTQNLYFRNTNGSGTTAWSTLLHGGNFNSYSPTLTGTGASGSWGISVTGSSASTTGNAATATTLQTARTINGVSFNGSANITVADSTKLPLAGGTMTGAITFAAGQTWPTFNQNTTGSAATLTTGRTIALTGDVTYTSGSFNGSANVTGTATLANSGVTAGTYTKITVDAKGRATVGASLTEADIPELTLAKLPGSTYKQSVRAATTANITLSAPQTIDGIALVAGDRVLVKDQTTTSQNGIYVVAAAAWTRSLDADASTEIGAAVVAVDSGTANGGEMWTTTFKTTDTLGTTAMLWYEVLYNTGSWGINVTGSSASTTGNAATATTLQTTRAINGTNFNGSAAITTANWGTARTLWGQSVNGSANITAPLLPAAGTTLLPAFSTSGDTNTGMWFPAADTIAFSEGGVEAMRINSTGQVSIGNFSTPASQLHVFTAGATDTRISVSNGNGSVQFGNTTDGNGIVGTSSPKDFVFMSNTTERMRINSTGNLGIGTSSLQSARLHVNGAGQGIWSNRTVLVESSAAAPSQPAIAFHAATNTAATILKLYGPTAYMEFRNDIDSGFANTAAASFVVGSDYRLKTDIVDLQSGLQDIMNLSPKKYTLFDSDKETRGFIAHEVSPHIPEAVIGEFNAEDERGFPIYQTLDPATILATAVAAIKELKVLIDQQAIEIQQLKEKLNA